MPIDAGTVVVELVSAGAGAAGATPIVGARRAIIRFTDIVTKEIPGNGGPAAVVVTYVRAQVAIETPSPTEAINHLAKTANEVLKLTYVASGGTKIMTIDPVAPTGSQDVTFMAPEEGGVITRSTLTWSVLATEAKKLYEAFTAAAAGT